MHVREPSSFYTLPRMRPTVRAMLSRVTSVQQRSYLLMQTVEVALWTAFVCCANRHTVFWHIILTACFSKSAKKEKKSGMQR